MVINIWLKVVYKWLKTVIHGFTWGSNSINGYYN